MRHRLKTFRNLHGFIKTFLIVVIVIVTLAYFNIDARALVENPIVKPVYTFIVNGTKVAWSDYALPAISYIAHIVPWSEIKNSLIVFFNKVQTVSETATSTPAQ